MLAVLSLCQCVCNSYAGLLSYVLSLSLLCIKRVLSRPATRRENCGKLLLEVLLHWRLSIEAFRLAVLLRWILITGPQVTWSNVLLECCCWCCKPVSLKNSITGQKDKGSEQ